MKLTNEVIVAAPHEQTWAVLLDVPRVASALPGASIEPDGVEGSYRGRLKLRLGPVSVEYEGAARLEDVDEDEHVASFYVEGREVRGHGGASATIRNRVIPEGDRTRVIVETDVAVTGRAAQLGRGLMEEVAGRLLEQFATRLEQEILAPSLRRAAPVRAEEPLDVGRAALGPTLRRYGLALAVAGGLALVAFALRRRRIVVVIERR